MPRHILVSNKSFLPDPCTREVLILLLQLSVAVVACAVQKLLAIPTCIFTPGLGIPKQGVLDMCHRALHSDLEQALSFTLAMELYTEGMLSLAHERWSFATRDISPGQAFVWPKLTVKQFCFTHYKWDVVKLDGLSALLSSVILHLWSSDTPYLLRIYYNLAFADY